MASRLHTVCPIPRSNERGRGHPIRRRLRSPAGGHAGRVRTSLSQQIESRRGKLAFPDRTPERPFYKTTPKDHLSAHHAVAQRAQYRKISFSTHLWSGSGRGGTGPSDPDQALCVPGRAHGGRGGFAKCRHGDRYCPFFVACGPKKSKVEAENTVTRDERQKKAEGGRGRCRRSEV